MITSDALVLDGIAHGYFTRRGGFSSGVFLIAQLRPGFRPTTATRLLRNRALVAQSLSVQPDCLLSAYQVHSPDALVVTEPWRGDERPRVDCAGDEDARDRAWRA